MNRFFKGHGLGNDYLVMDPADLAFRLTPKAVRSICDRNIGVGGDGILAVTSSSNADFGVRIYNPDGSEAEKSGNGLRIFGMFLYATGRTTKSRFTVETVGGVVKLSLHVDETGFVDSATVEMGGADFRPQSLPCLIDTDELVNQPIEAAGRELSFTGVSVGNPHCVVFRDHGEEWTRDELHEIGPALENHPVFPNRVNVQLAVPLDQNSINILIWERGAGETLASGSSGSAAASAAVRLGLVESPVVVRSSGGQMQVEVDDDFDIILNGPVSEVMSGQLSPGFVKQLQNKE